MKKTPDPMKRPLPDYWYFRKENYRNAVIIRPDNDANTLVCHRVGGKPVIVRFQKKLRNWRVECEVDIALEAKPEEFIRYHTGIEATDAVIDFWEMLATKTSTAYRESLSRIGGEIEKMFGPQS